MTDTRALTENWQHDPPCLRGGYIEVSPHAMTEDEACPLCGAALIAPKSVREARDRRDRDDSRLEAAWQPKSPREIVAMGAARKPPDA